MVKKKDINKLAFRDHGQKRKRDIEKEGRSVGVKIDQNSDHGEKGKEKGKEGYTTEGDRFGLWF